MRFIRSSACKSALLAFAGTLLLLGLLLVLSSSSASAIQKGNVSNANVTVLHSTSDAVVVPVVSSVNKDNPGRGVGHLVRDASGRQLAADVFEVAVVEKESANQLRVANVNANANNKNNNIDSSRAHQHDVSAPKKRVVVQPHKGPVRKVVLDEVVGDLDIGLDDVDESIPAPFGAWQEVFAIDPEGTDFVNGSVTVVAKGTALYKCADWNFSDRSCGGDWVFLQHTVPGEEYLIELSPNDPGFGEIIATGALHVDENGFVLGDIYSEIVAIDEVWSPAIFEGQSVLVTFERPLTAVNTIDFVARGSEYAFIEIYDALDGSLVTRSSALGVREHHFLSLEDWDGSSAVFEFRVVQEFPDPSDNTTDINTSAVASVSFDFIHDEALIAELGHGLIVYEGNGVTAPHTRFWNTSVGDFGAETNALSVGEEILWVRLEANHEREEMVLVTQDASNDVNFQVLGSSGSWSNLTEVSFDVPNGAYRAFDVAIEQLSGDVLLVYESSSGSDSTIAYRLWDGSSLSDEYTLSLPTASSPVEWVVLRAKSGSDSIMAIMQTSAGELYAVPWDGDDFVTDDSSVITSSPSSGSSEHFDFAWESSGDGLLSYGSGLSLYLVPFSSGSWGLSSSIYLGHSARFSYLCADLNSDYVGVITQDTGNDVYIEVWGGSSIIAGSPQADYNTEITGDNAKNAVCAWSGDKALFAYAEYNQKSISYGTYDRSGNSWSTSSFNNVPTYTVAFSTYDIHALDISVSPVTDEVFIVASDLAEDVSTILWNGSAFVSIPTNPVENNANTINGNQHNAQFDWYRYDPNPSVIVLQPSEDSVINLSDSIILSVNVSDNVAVDSVWASVSLPNGSVFNVSLLDGNSDGLFNSSFDKTATRGSYTIRYFANDTSIFANVNDSEVASFTVQDPVDPLISDFSPAGLVLFNVSDTVNITVNATDNYGIASVVANVSFPDGNFSLLTMSSNGGDRYNVSFVVPELVGQFDVVVTVTDEEGNTNVTSGSFLGNDTTPPSFSGFSPVNGFSWTLEENGSFGVVVDDFSTVVNVTLNVSAPNGSVYVVELNESVNGTYNASFVHPGLLGRYNRSFWAVDIFGNAQFSSSGFFFINDSLSPDLVILSPSFASSFSQNASVNLSANLSDNFGVASVWVDVTLPNTTVRRVWLFDHDSDGVFNASFNESAGIGSYLASFGANDSTGNDNVSESISFSVLDSSTPLSTLVSPTDGSVIASSSIDFFCSATDNNGLANISLFHNIGQSFGLAATNPVSGLENQTSFTVAGISDGDYLFNCLATDDAGNNAFASANISFSVDITAPTVIGLNPQSIIFEYFDAIVISATVFDANGVGSVLVNLSYPNGSLLTHPLVDPDGNDVYTFSLPLTDRPLGTYEYTIVASDNYGNVNNLQSANFSVVDLVAPTFVSSSCVPLAANLSDAVNCSIVVNDTYGVSSTAVNLSYPNATVVVGPVNQSWWLFSSTLLTGDYFVNWSAVDTSGNGAFILDSFNVSDNISASIVLGSSANSSSISSNFSVNYTVTDNYADSLTCSFFVSGLLNQSSVVANGSLSYFNISGLVEGSFDWFVSCDDSSLVANSSVFSHTVDRSPPSFVSLTTDPPSEAGLDPGVNMSVFANVSDSLTNVSFVKLQFINDSNVSSWTNISLSYNISSALFEGVIVNVTNGTYVLRLYASDVLGNVNSSVNVSKVVAFDSTWSVSPSSFYPTSTDPDAVVGLGNFTIANTGDFVRNFSLSSNQISTYFNVSSPFLLGVGENITINVTETAPTIGSQVTTITITDANASPAQAEVDGLIITTPGQPILVTSVLFPSLSSVEVAEGSVLEMQIEVANIGEADAFNGSLRFVLPSSWSLAMGSLNNSFSELFSGDSLEYIIRVNVPESASGSNSVLANVSGVNVNGTDLDDLGLAIDDSLTVLIEGDNLLQPSSGGGDTPPDDGGGGDVDISVPDSGGGGGGSFSVPSDIQEVVKESLVSEQSFTVLSGDSVSFSLNISNPIRGGVMDDVTIDVLGLLADFVSYTPDFLEDIAFNTSKSFAIDVAVPSYLEGESFMLVFLIQGAVVMGGDEQSAGQIIEFEEERTVTINIREVALEEAMVFVDAADKVIASLNESGFSSALVDEYYAALVVALDAKEYDMVRQYSKLITSIQSKILQAKGALVVVEEQMADARRRGLDVTETERVYALALKAFESENYDLAIRRAEQAEKVRAFETQNSFNLLNFLRRFWWALMTGLLFSALLGTVVYNRVSKVVIDTRLQYLIREEAAIEHLIVDLQQEAFTDKSIGMNTFHKKMFKYEHRKGEIKRLMSKLRIKKLGLTDPLHELQSLEDENERLINDMRQAQDKYFNSMTISRKNYERLVTELNLRLAELEEAIASVKFKLAKDGMLDPATGELLGRKKTFKHVVLRWVSRLSGR